MGATVEKLRRIGPRPVLLTQYVVHHARRRLRDRTLRRTYASRIAQTPAGASLRLMEVELPPARELPGPLLPAAERLRAEAEHVIAHRVDYLGSGLVPLGEEIDWNRDFKSGYRWEPAFYQDVEVTRLTDSSDAKVPWELSRGHQLLTLARAARLFEDERFAAELERQLESWLDASPTGYGINWTNPMEAAIRAANWLWALAILEPFRPLAPALGRRVTVSLQAHLRHIAANLEGTPQLRSNHYLADIFGLLVVGAALDGDREADRAFRRAHGWFEREIRAQVHEDGIGFEASLPYHGLALELFLLAAHVAERAGRTFSPRYTERLLRMHEASRALRQPDGRLPQLGDADSGRILPAGFDRPPTLDHLLWLGAAILGRPRPLPGPPHEEVAWTLGVDVWQELATRPEAGPPTGAAFPAGGVYVLRADGAHLVVRCGDIGQNGNGGHAHNDVLSYELSLGTPLVVDSGTYVYTSDPASRNAFRSTRAHNTVVVAGEEINPIEPDDLFRLEQVARPSVEVFESGPDSLRLVASHDGYARLSPGVVHRRSFSLERKSGALDVVDELLGDGFQRAEWFLHLAPGTTVERAGEILHLVRGRVRAELTFSGADSVELTEGWVSERFGTREAAPVLVGRVSGELPLCFGHRLVPVSTAAPVTALEHAGAAP